VRDPQGKASVGGGINNQRGTVQLYRANISQCSSTSSTTNGGGGIYSLLGRVMAYDSILQRNSATFNGGGIFSASSTVILRRTTLRANTGATIGVHSCLPQESGPGYRRVHQQRVDPIGLTTGCLVILHAGLSRLERPPLPHHTWTALTSVTCHLPLSLPQRATRGGGSSRSLRT
jgi:predicted outer membrane repeat protein